MDQQAYWIWLSKTKTIEEHQKRMYITQKEQPSVIYKHYAEKSNPIALDYAKSVIQTNAIHGIKMITPDDERYSAGMSIVLYYIGKPFLGNTAAVVGTRKCTANGYYYTMEIVRKLIDQNVAINSGLAYGIDAIAHKTALSKGGITQAYLAHGLDQCYPKPHQQLLNRIIKTGCVYSTYEVGISAQKYRFLERNTLMASLSDEVIVVEAGESSGAFYTGREAFNLNKRVSTIKGPDDSNKCSGNNRLIEMGANQLHIALEGFDESDNEIVNFIKMQPSTIEALMTYTGLSTPTLESWLLEFEYRRWIVQKADGKWHYNGW